LTKRLEDLFGLAPPSEDASTETEVTDETVTEVVSASKNTLLAIEQALPAVHELAQIDAELDNIANKAMASFEELSDLGMNVDSRFAAEIFSVASSMMGHALSAKTAKASRKLKTIEMQMKKMRLEMDLKKSVGTPPPIVGDSFNQAEGKVLSRNELMQMLNPRGAASQENDK
jgi:hypothetical protein